MSQEEHFSGRCKNNKLKTNRSPSVDNVICLGLFCKFVQLNIKFLKNKQLKFAVKN